MLTPSKVLDLYFLEARCMLIEVVRPLTVLTAPLIQIQMAMAAMIALRNSMNPCRCSPPRVRLLTGLSNCSSCFQAPPELDSEITTGK